MVMQRRFFIVKVRNLSLIYTVCGHVFDPLIAAWLLDPEVDAENILKIFPTYSHGKKSIPKVSQEADAVCAEVMIYY